MPAKKIIIALTIIIVAVAGFVAGLYLLQQPQEPERAAVPGGSATVEIQPATGNFNVGDNIETSVFFNTANIAINGIAIRLRYPYTGQTPEVTVSGIDINNTLLSSGDWQCPTKTASQQGDNVLIDIACGITSAQGYTNSENTLLAKVNLRVNRTPQNGQLTITFDPSASIITQKSTGQDILLIPQSTGSYTVGGGNIPTATVAPTATPGVTSAATPTVTPRLTVTSSPTPTATSAATISPIGGKGGVEELPDAGVSYPTVLGLGLGILVIIGALALAF
jgi:hypothetical protein